VPITSRDMSAVAFDTELGFEDRLRALPRPPVAVEPEAPAASAANVDIEPWEVHSELVLVCPDVCKRALELLPERDPDAFLARSREPISFAIGSAGEAKFDANLPAAVLGYALWRLAETARTALIVFGAVFALALAAQIPH
jgi:hypothetical protein